MRKVTLQQVLEENEYSYLTLKEVVDRYYETFLKWMPGIIGIPYDMYKRLMWNAITTKTEITDEELKQFLSIDDPESDFYEGEYPESLNRTYMSDYFGKYEPSSSYYSEDYYNKKKQAEEEQAQAEEQPVTEEPEVDEGEEVEDVE